MNETSPTFRLLISQQAISDNTGLISRYSKLSICVRLLSFTIGTEGTHSAITPRNINSNSPDCNAGNLRFQDFDMSPPLKRVFFKTALLSYYSSWIIIFTTALKRQSFCSRRYRISILKFELSCRLPMKKGRRNVFEFFA